MPEAVVVAQYVNPPQAGKKQGSIKTPTGEYYGVSPAMLSMFKAGGTYKIFFESREYQGKTYHTVKTVSETAPPPPKDEAAGSSAGVRDDRGPKSWVCHLLGQAIAAGKIDALALSDVVEAGRIYRDAEKLIFSDKPVPEKSGPDDDMKDEIPF